MLLQSPATIFIEILARDFVNLTPFQRNMVTWEPGLEELHCVVMNVRSILVVCKDVSGRLFVMST